MLPWGGAGGAGRAGRGLTRMRPRAACREAEAEARVSPRAMAAGGLSRSERKAAERVRRLREEQQRERLRQVRRPPPRPASPARAALTALPAPAGVAHPEEGGCRAQRGGGPASGRERGPGDRAAGPKQAARGPEATAAGGESRGAPGSAGAGRAGRGLRPAWGSRQVCDDPEELRRKVRELAGAVRNAEYLVVYTGAGISTVGRRAWTVAHPGRLLGPGQTRNGEGPGAPPSGCLTQGPSKVLEVE